MSAQAVRRDTEVIAERHDAIGERARIVADRPLPAERGKPEADHAPAARRHGTASVDCAEQHFDLPVGRMAGHVDASFTRQREAHVAPFGI